MTLDEIKVEALKIRLVGIIHDQYNEGNELEDLDNYTPIQITNGLSRWALQDILDETDSEKINKKILDRTRNKKTGNIGEFGCDIFENDALITFGQTKYHKKFGDSINVEDIEKIENTIDYLGKEKVVGDKTRYGPLDENDEPLGSEEFQEASKAFVTEKDKTKKIIFITTETLKENTQAHMKWTELKKKYPSYRFEMYDIERILKIAVDPITPPVTLKFKPNEWYGKLDPVTEMKSRSGIVSAKDLEKIISDHDDVIFNWNPRKQLGRSSVTFGSITKTLEDEDEQKQFYKLSNGITAVCKEIHGEKNDEINIENLKITNGRQTTFALQEFQAIMENNLDYVELEIRIHEVKGKDEGAKISIANNKQNKTDEIDLLALDPRMENLQISLNNKFNDANNKGLWFLERQRRAWIELDIKDQNRFTFRRRLEKEPLIRGTIAYCINLSKALLGSSKFIFEGSTLLDSFYKQKEEDMLLVHIFHSCFVELKKKYDPKKEDEKERWYLYGKAVVHYNLLSLIRKELEGFDDNEREKIEGDIIKIFHDMKKGPGNRDIPKKLLDIAENAMERFMKGYRMNKKNWYPTEKIEKEKDGKITIEERIRSPTHKEIEDHLKGSGNDAVTEGLDPNIVDTIMKDMAAEDKLEDKPPSVNKALREFLPETATTESDNDKSDSEPKEENNS